MIKKIITKFGLIPALVFQVYKDSYRNYQYESFVKKWRKINSNNFTTPKNIFPIEKVFIGEYTYGDLNIYTYSDNPLEKLIIGNYVSIAANVSFVLGGNHKLNTFSTYPIKAVLINNNFRAEEDSYSKGPITVEDEVWIGLNCIILSGVKIGKGAVIAAGSVVTKDVEPYSIVGGFPAKHIKYRFEKSIIEQLLSVSLYQMGDKFIEDNLDLLYKTISPDNNTLSEILKKNNEKAT